MENNEYSICIFYIYWGLWKKRWLGRRRDKNTTKWLWRFIVLDIARTKNRGFWTNTKIASTNIWNIHIYYIVQYLQSNKYGNQQYYISKTGTINVRIHWYGRKAGSQYALWRKHSPCIAQYSYNTDTWYRVRFWIYLFHEKLSKVFGVSVSRCSSYPLYYWYDRHSHADFILLFKATK